MSTAPRQVVPYFGSDVHDAGQIVETIGPHDAYLETFAGGLSILFAKPRVTNERVNDLNGELVNLARALSSEKISKWLEDKLARTVFCDAIFDSARLYVGARRDAGLDNRDAVDEMGHWAYCAFVVAWMGRGGFSGTKTIPSISRRHDNGGGWGGSRFRHAAEGVGWMHDRLRTVEITRGDGIALAESMRDEDGLAIFCDPPFIVEGAQYLHPFKTSASGEGIFGREEDDHDRLAAVLNAKQATRVVVEYHPHERLEALYPRERWRRVELASKDQLSNRVASSVLLVNDAQGPSETPVETPAERLPAEGVIA